MIILVGVSLAEARTTILVVPLVALRNDLLGRFYKAGIQPLLWTTETRRSASLVLVSVEAACSEQFLEYAQRLAMRQQLDRVIIDECHLTITASEYRESMVQLGWYLGQIKVQNVWLTATLPPIMQDEFIQQNKLVRPRIVRESTNRPNIKYLITVESKSLLESVTDLICTYWTTEIFDKSRDKIIVYCNTREEARMLGEMLDCPVYTSESGTWKQKATLIQEWLANSEQPAVIATTALGPGFDYPYIRWVIHVDAPRRLSDFSQASGRAGRAGQPATSIVFLPSTWKPSVDTYPTPDHEAMELYLTRQYCYRGILSQFLDAPIDWRWCMDRDEPCGVCKTAHAEARPYGLEYALKRQPQIIYDGPGEVVQQDCLQDRVLEQYEHNLTIMRGICLYCRAMSRSFEHAASSCHRRWDWIKAKKDVLEELKGRDKEWISQYVACWKCFQPQGICRVADPEHAESECQYPDMVLPLCYGVFVRPHGRAWIRQHFQRHFTTVQEYMIWLGETGSLQGNECIQGNCVAAQALSEFG
jgi:hypothetical protein